MLRTSFLAGMILILCAGVVLTAPPAAPAPPEEYDAVIRFVLPLKRVDRIATYNAFVAALKDLGFRRDVEPIPEDNEPVDIRLDHFTGVLPSKNVRKVLELEPVLSVLVLPKGVALPEDKTQGIFVRLELPARFANERQQLLYNQTLQALEGIGFESAVGHDHRGFTILAGRLPADKVGLLAGDLRKLPGTEKLPAPFAERNVARLIEAFPQWKIEKRPTFTVSPALEKLTPELREIVQGEDKDLVRRFEVILAQTPAARDRLWQTGLLDSGLTIEGRLGALVTVQGRYSAALVAARLPEVAGVRLPRLGRSELPRDFVVDPRRARPLVANDIPSLEKFTNGGRGSRLAVVDADFRGWSEAVGKGLPTRTRLVDLTCERNRDLQPDPFGPESAEPGTGTKAALALARLAPEAELTLVRVDPAAPYMLQAVAQAIAGEGYRSLSLDQRIVEMENTRAILSQRGTALADERKRVLAEFAAEEEPERERLVLKRMIQSLLCQRILGFPVRLDNESLTALVVALDQTPEIKALPGGKVSRPGVRRLLYRVRQDFYDRDLAEHQARTDRFNAFFAATSGLRGIRTVLSGPVWNEGFPLNGTSPLSRYFDDRPFRAALWFQATAETGGQAWSGLFRDADNNGVMEFAPTDTALPNGTWTRELNFLKWAAPERPKAGPVLEKADEPLKPGSLPEKARLRVSLQWREVQDPMWTRIGEDPYRQSSADLRIIVLFQPDPQGKNLPSDLLEVVAESTGPALRLEKTANSSVYEQTVLVPVGRPGRYAVRIEGMAPTSIQPRGVPTLPGKQTTFELTPRLFVETLSGSGRAAFETWTTAEGPGMPADARAVVPLK